MSFYGQYPSSAGGSNPSIGTNGAVAPTSSTEVGGINPSGNLQPLKTDASGNLLISLAADPIDPLGTNIEQFGGSAVVTGVGNSGAGIPRVTVSSDSNLNNISGTISLPTGAATQTTLATVSTTLGSILLDLTNGTQVTTVAAGSAIIGKVGIDQTTPGTTNAVTITNGANVSAVKAASTAPVAADPALVVSISPNTPAVPVSQIDATASGNITTQNLNPNSGAATAGSTVAVTSLEGQTSWSVQVTGTYTGALTPQVTVDGSNWIALSATAVTNINTNAQAATIASAAVGIFEISAPPCAQLRMTALAAVTGTAVVSIRVSSSTTRVGLDSPIPAGTAIIGALSANQSSNVAQINGVAPLMGNGVTGTGSLRVTLASDTTSNSNAFNVKETTSATGTNTNVASSATSVTILASNANRLGATVFNDSTQVLYLNVGSTAASTTNYTVQMPSNAYYEIPPAHIYTGAITGIWASANGNARVTELS